MTYRIPTDNREEPCTSQDLADAAEERARLARVRLPLDEWFTALAQHKLAEERNGGSL